MAASRPGERRKGRKAGTRDAPDTGPRRGFRFTALNYGVMAVGVAAIVLGYILLDDGSVTAAPLLLVLGYAVLLPLGVLLGWKRLGAGEAGEGDRG